MQSPEALLLLLLELEVQHALRGHPADGTQLALMVHSRHAWVAFQPAVLVAVQWPRHAYQGTDTSCTDLERSPTLWSRQGQLLPWQRARGGEGTRSHRPGHKPVLVYTRLCQLPSQAPAQLKCADLQSHFKKLSRRTCPQHDYTVQHSLIQARMDPLSRCTHLADLQHDHAVQHSLGQSGVTHEGVLTPGDVGPIGVCIQVPAHPVAQSRQMGAQADVGARHKHRV